MNLVPGDFAWLFLARAALTAVAATGVWWSVARSGRPSLGHAGFLALGAQASTFLVDLGVPAPLGWIAAVIVGAGVGQLLLRGFSRLGGVSFALATLAFAEVVRELLRVVPGLSGGLDGKEVPALRFGGEWSGPAAHALLAFALLAATAWSVANLDRGPFGRACRAVRQSRSTAESLGISAPRTDAASFAFGAAVSALAGAFLAQDLGHLGPDSFGLTQSVELLVVAVLAGTRSWRSVPIAAAAVVGLPLAIGSLRRALPARGAELPDLESGLFGVLLLVLVFTTRSRTQADGAERSR